MGDMGDVFKEMKEERQIRHESWKEKNTSIIEKSGLKYDIKNEGNTLSFRLDGIPKTDFFPSTGRWRTHNPPRTYSGGALKFLEWIKTIRK